MAGMSKPAHSHEPTFAGTRYLEDKIIERSALAGEILRLRAARPTARIVFTNGCFDLLHPGHVRYLQEARLEGDVLLVAMNDDDSIRRLKGPTRPILPLRERLKVMAALGCVDMVTSFHEDTPIPLLEETRPDVLVKGGDYPVTGVVGHELVMSWGGAVKVLSLSPGHSTTAIESRMKALAR